jgi:hypothetical protein
MIPAISLPGKEKKAHFSKNLKISNLFPKADYIRKKVLKFIFKHGIVSFLGNTDND